LNCKADVGDVTEEWEVLGSEIRYWS
jgi:hypothetical protein